MWYYLTLPYLTLPYLTLPYLTLPYLTLPYIYIPSRTFLITYRFQWETSKPPDILYLILLINNLFVLL